MELALRKGISFCHVGGRTIFLDILADRYFCLSGAAESSFIRLVENGGSARSDDEYLSGLVSRGLLVSSPIRNAPLPCSPPLLPEASVLDRRLPPAGLRQTMSALCGLGMARIRLKVAGLARTVSLLAAGKARLPTIEHQPDPLLENTMAGFVRAARVASLLDTCLAHSIAVASRMVSQGIRPDVVLGVQLGPFAAHCWVQHGNRLVNDRFDIVRTFTPILVI